MNMLENIPLWQHHFRIALLIRESIFLNSILTNVEIWYGLNNTEIKQLEDLDLNLLRRFLNTPFSVPSEAVYLELRCLNILTIIETKRLIYLHCLVTDFVWRSMEITTGKKKKNISLHHAKITQTAKSGLFNAKNNKEKFNVCLNYCNIFSENFTQ